jgi:hypothetical protein
MNAEEKLIRAINGPGLIMAVLSFLALGLTNADFFSHEG